MNKARTLLTVFLFFTAFLSAEAEADVTRLKNWGFQVPETRSPAVLIKVTDQSGTALTIPKKNKITLINFWASWCPPCRAEMPSLDRLYQTLKGEGFQLAAVNMNEEVSYVQDFMLSAGLNLPVYYFPETNSLNAYKLRGIPSSFLVDKNGMVAAVLIGSTEWDNPEIIRTIRELLEES